MAAMQLSIIEEKMSRGDYSFLDASSAAIASAAASGTPSASTSVSYQELKGEHKKRTEGIEVEGLKSGEAIIATGEFRGSIDVGTHVFVILNQDEHTRRETRGIIKTILTEKAYHVDGIKVILTIGEVGRVTKVIGPASSLEPGATPLIIPSSNTAATSADGASVPHSISMPLLPSRLSTANGGLAATISQFVPQSIMSQPKEHDPTKRPTAGASLMDFVVDKRKPKGRLGKTRASTASGNNATIEASKAIDDQPGENKKKKNNNNRNDGGDMDPDLLAAIEASRITAEAEQAMGMNLPSASSLERKEGEVELKGENKSIPPPSSSSTTVTAKKGTAPKMVAAKIATPATPATSSKGVEVKSVIKRSSSVSTEGMRELVPKSKTFTIGASDVGRAAASLANARNSSFEGGSGSSLRPIGKGTSSYSGVPPPSPAKSSAKLASSSSISASIGSATTPKTKAAAKVAAKSAPSPAKVALSTVSSQLILHSCFAQFDDDGHRKWHHVRFVINEWQLH
jgi:uncharacterized repeat protein (TIGR03833 family)